MNTLMNDPDSKIKKTAKKQLKLLKAQEINQILNELGFHKKWLDYGFLTLEELPEQYAKYKNARQNPDEDFYGDQHPEHLRYSAFLRLIERKEKFTNKEVEKIIELVKLDKDEIMAKNALKYLVEMKKVDDTQIEKFHLQSYFS